MTTRESLTPADKLAAKIRCWKNLKVYSDRSADFTEDFVGERDADMPAYTVFSPTAR